MNPGIDARDQRQFPAEPLDLPDAECRESDDPQQGETEEEQPSQRWVSISAPPIGIMFWLRWYMIHIEPEITISTITAAKA